MAGRPFLVLTRREIEPLINLEVAISVVEAAFRDFAKGESFLYPVIRQKIDPYEGFFGVKAGYMSTKAYVGYKGGGFWSRNIEEGIAGHQSLIVIYDARNGIPLAALDGNYLTVIRTGAVGAIAAKYLARKDSQRVAIIGAGAQGKIQLEALSHVLRIREPDFCIPL